MIPLDKNIMASVVELMEEEHVYCWGWNLFSAIADFVSPNFWNQYESFHWLYWTWDHIFYIYVIPSCPFILSFSLPSTTSLTFFYATALVAANTHKQPFSNACGVSVHVFEEAD